MPDGQAARAIDHEPVPGEADLAADRALNVRPPVCAYGREFPGEHAREDRSCGPAQARSVRRSLDANDPLVELNLVAEVGSADDSARSFAGERIKGVDTPNAADLAADIDAGPGEDRGRRRRRRAKIGGDRRPGEGNGARRRK